LDEIKTLLLGHGAAGALMSGSGPTIFGVFDNEDMAMKAEESLQGCGTWYLFRAHTI